MIKNYLTWYAMFTKRLLKKPGFIILLLLIPVLIPLGNTIMTKNSGILKIALYSEDKGSYDIVSHLGEKDSIILFEEYKEKEKAIHNVQEGNIDAAWIFCSDFEEKINYYASGKSKEPFVEIYESEETIPLKISKEVLYEALYESISYSLYSGYTKKEIIPEIEENELHKFYNSERLRDIIEIKRLNPDVEVKKINYLTAPLRGFLSVLVILCALAAAMYFLEDNKSGRYDWLAKNKRIAPAFASCLSASILSSLAVFLAICISGNGNSVSEELLLSLIFAVSSAGFGVLFCIIFSSPLKLGACIPGIIIVTIVLSPIFFNLQILKPLRMMLPTHYYLYSVNDNKYIAYMIMYTAIIYALVFIINSLKGKIK